MIEPAQESSQFDDRDSSSLGIKVEPPYFFGAYEKFQPVGGDPFATEGWISHCRALIHQWNSPPPLLKIKLAIKAVIKKTLQIPVNKSPIVEHIKQLLANQNKISILDVGGGFGDNFYHIEKALGSLSKRVDYIVVDNETQCSFGKKFYRKSGKNISFTTVIPRRAFDCVIVIGTIQYIENWREFVSELAKKSTGSIFISRTPLNVSGPTFVTVQSICPAFGSSALTKIGESNLNVINETELDETFKKMDL